MKPVLPDICLQLTKGKYVLLVLQISVREIDRVTGIAKSAGEFVLRKQKFHHIYLNRIKNGL